jgi:hypothetical protein
MTDQLATAPVTPATVQNQLNALVTGSGATYATKTYVDGQDTLYQPTPYYITQDSLNLPTAATGLAKDWRLFDTTWRATYATYVNSLGDPRTALPYVSWLANQTVTGTPGTLYGAATLDATSRVPLNQTPVAGGGYVRGPWGPTTVATGTTAATPLRIADWNIGVANVQFRPWAFLSAFVTSASGQPVIEIRMSDSTIAPAFASMTPIAQGVGRNLFNDYHAITVIPAPDTTGVTPSLLPTTYNVWMTAWLWDLNATSVTISTGGVASGAACLLRGAV